MCKIINTKDLHTNKIKILIYGNSGVGKTSLLGTLKEDETLIISAESGLLCLANKNIDVVEVKNFDELISTYKLSKKEDKYKNICIDSLTEISDLTVSHLENQSEYKDPKMALKMWGEYNKKMTDIIKRFRNLDKNVFFTALVEDVQDGGFIVKKPFIKGSATQKLLESYFDEVFYLKVDESTKKRIVQTQPTLNISAKDRSGKLGTEEEANLIDIINKIKGNINA